MEGSADYETIWRLQDEIHSVVNAVVGEYIWNLSYNNNRQAIELELTLHLEEEPINDLCSQFSIPADYDGEGTHGTKIALYP